MDTSNESKALEQFVDRLIEEKQLSNLEPEVLGRLKEELRQRAEDRIKAAIFENIPEERLPEFDQLLQAGDAAALQSFVSAALPNLSEVTAQALLDLRASYLG